MDKYGDNDGIEKQDIFKYVEMFKDKKYCMIIYLENPEKITAFQINKKGFEVMSAWITVKDITSTKI